MLERHIHQVLLSHLQQWHNGYTARRCMQSQPFLPVLYIFSTTYTKTGRFLTGNSPQWLKHLWQWHTRGKRRSDGLARFEPRSSLQGYLQKRKSDSLGLEYPVLEQGGQCWYTLWQEHIDEGTQNSLVHVKVEENPLTSLTGRLLDPLHPGPLWSVLSTRFSLSQLFEDDLKKSAVYVWGRTFYREHHWAVSHAVTAV